MRQLCVVGQHNIPVSINLHSIFSNIAVHSFDGIKVFCLIEEIYHAKFNLIATARQEVRQEAIGGDVIYAPNKKHLVAQLATARTGKGI